MRADGIAAALLPLRRDPANNERGGRHMHCLSDLLGSLQRCAVFTRFELADPCLRDTTGYVLLEESTVRSYEFHRGSKRQT